MSWTENQKLDEWIERAYENGKREERERIIGLLMQLPVSAETYKLIQSLKDETNV
jgi:hypothetical protein